MLKSYHVIKMHSLKHCALLLFILLFSSCQQSTQKAQQNEKASLPSTGNFGEAIEMETAVPADQLPGVFADSDTIELTLSGNIVSSCKHTGCWMDIDMGDQSTVHVTFKDDQFTIPLDAEGKHAIAQGTAIRELIPVETLRNYAREEGQSEEDVMLITEPVWTYDMIATGVLIEEN